MISNFKLQYIMDSAQRNLDRIAQIIMIPDNHHSLTYLSIERYRKNKNQRSWIINRLHDGLQLPEDIKLTRVLDSDNEALKYEISEDQLKELFKNKEWLQSFDNIHFIAWSLYQGEKFCRMRQEIYRQMHG